MLDAGFYKNNKLLMSQQQISVGHQADKFIPQMLGSSEIAELSDALPVSFDLGYYPNKLKITLKEGTDGRFTFIGETCNQYSEQL